MVKNAHGHDPKNEHSIDICFSPFWFSPWNYIALAGLEVMLGHTWFQHGQLESAWSRGHELLNKLQFVCLLKQVTFFYSNCHWKILINIDFFLYTVNMFTWLFKGSVHINNSSYTIYKSLHFNPIIPLYLSPVIKQLALNKKCTVVLV